MSGLGLVLIPSLPLLAHWFDTKLSLAQGLAASGSGLGGLVLANTTRAALEHLGVKWALIINGAISGIVLFPAIALLKGRHKAVGARSAPYEAKWFLHPGFIWVLLWAFFASES
jgi:sugar phosphate permease